MSKPTPTKGDLAGVVVFGSFQRAVNAMVRESTEQHQKILAQTNKRKVKTRAK